MSVGCHCQLTNVTLSKKKPARFRRFRNPIPKLSKVFMNSASKMIKALIIFGTGLYTGVYIAQNYQIDKVEDPKVLFEKAQAFIKSKLGDMSGDSKKDDGKRGGREC